jgi:DNA-binding winged helix-turn-helix (wHTH) protein/tetratricopeptide (TPR) repeat protein
VETPVIFGPFRLDLVNQCLWRNEQQIDLTPKSFAVLCHLLEHPARLVTKQELLDAVWPRGYVSDGVLKVCIREIRKAIDDDPKAPRFIETRHRRGYRFIAEIAADETGGLRSVAAGPGPFPKTLPRIPRLALLSPARLVEREAVLAELQKEMDVVLAGTRRTVFVTGEPGIGKTTVVQAFLEGLAASPLLITSGQCLEQYGSGEAYLPVLEAMGGLARSALRTRVLELLGQYAPTWLIQMPSLLPGAEIERLKQQTLGATRERMLREVAEALEAIAVEVPLVLVLEDLQWSDYATLDLISYLARRNAPARLLLLGTYRPADVLTGRHPLQGVKTDLQTHGRCAELPLTSLTQQAINEYLAAQFPQNDFPAELPALIQCRTEGNPLFMVNVLDYLTAQGLIAKSGERWGLKAGIEAIDVGVPENVQQMVEQQMERLSDTEQGVLEAASVAGMAFSSAQAAAALEQDHVEVEGVCQHLARRRLFIRASGRDEPPLGTPGQRYAFIHSFYQNLWYLRIGTAGRTCYHQRLGEHGERSYGAGAREVAAELATHFEQSRDYPRAVHYLRLAADNSARRSANREAVGYLTRALALVERLPETERVDRHLAVLEQLGLVRRSMGYDVEGAMQTFRTLAAEAHEQGRIDYEVKALCYLAVVLAWVDVERCLATAEQAVALSTKLADPLLRAHARSFYGHWHSLFREWRAEDVRACEEAMDAAHRAGDSALVMTHAGRCACFQFLQSHYRAACRTAREGMQIALELGDGFEHMHCQFYLLLALLHLGQWGEMRRIAEQAIELAEKNGHPFWAMLFGLELAWLHLHAFDYQQALLLCEREFNRAQQLRYGPGQQLSLVLLGDAHLGLGEYGPALQCFTEASSLAEAPGRPTDWSLQLPLHQGLGECYLAKGDLDGARREAERACAMATAPGQRTWLAFGRLTLAEIALAEGVPDQAEHQIAKALAALEDIEAPLAQWRVYAMAARLRQEAKQDTEAEWYRSMSAQILSQLAQSLVETPTLRDALLNAVPVQELLGGAATGC